MRVINCATSVGFLSDSAGTFDMDTEINRNRITNCRNLISSSYVPCDAVPNVGVDAAARIQSSIAGPIILRNTLPPLASDLFSVLAPESRSARLSALSIYRTKLRRASEHRADVHIPEGYGVLGDR